MGDFAEEIAPGTVVQWAVGWPGPDCDMAIVTKCYGLGKHQIMFQVWGSGPFHFSDVQSPLWPEPMYPRQWNTEQAAKLRSEYAAREARDD